MFVNVLFKVDENFKVNRKSVIVTLVCQNAKQFGNYASHAANKVHSDCNLIQILVNSCCTSMQNA